MWLPYLARSSTGRKRGSLTDEYKQAEKVHYQSSAVSMSEKLLCSIGSVHIEREGESSTLSFVGGNVDEILEKIVE